MNKLTSTARKIDIVFKIFNVALVVSMVAVLAGLAFTGAGMIFHLPVEDVPKLDQSFSTGAFTFYTEFEVMSFDALFPWMGLVLAAALAMLIPAWMAVQTIRGILKPMTGGQPFHSAVSRNLKRLAWLTLITGGMYQLLQEAKLLLSKVLFGIEWRLFGQTVFAQINPEFKRFADNIHLQATPAFDLGFLVLAAVIFLLAYVFNYGEQLQTLSDETL